MITATTINQGFTAILKAFTGTGTRLRGLLRRQGFLSERARFLARGESQNSRLECLKSKVLRWQISPNYKDPYDIFAEVLGGNVTRFDVGDVFRASGKFPTEQEIRHVTGPLGRSLS